MRYPGPSIQERRLRGLIFTAALLFFVVNLSFAWGKLQNQGRIEASTPKVTKPRVSPSPTTTPTVTFQFFDTASGEAQPIANQAVAITIKDQSCTDLATCPAPTSMVIQTDASGIALLERTIVVDNQLSFYAPGYHLDSKFTVNRDEGTVTLYEAPPGMKSIYTLDNVIPIVMKPANTY